MIVALDDTARARSGRIGCSAGSVQAGWDRSSSARTPRAGRPRSRWCTRGWPTTRGSGRGSRARWPPGVGYGAGDGRAPGRRRRRDATVAGHRIHRGPDARPGGPRPRADPGRRHDAARTGPRAGAGHHPRRRAVAPRHQAVERVAHRRRAAVDRLRDRARRRRDPADLDRRHRRDACVHSPEQVGAGELGLPRTCSPSAACSCSPQPAPGRSARPRRWCCCAACSPTPRTSARSTSRCARSRPPACAATRPRPNPAQLVEQLAEAAERRSGWLPRRSPRWRPPRPAPPRRLRAG